MSVDGIKALTFDTGGTILDWHTGVRDALSELGKAHGVNADWAAATNDFRRQSLGAMVNHGADGPATLNIDDIHRQTLDKVAANYGLGGLTEAEKHRVWWNTMHNLKCWPDFPATLPKLREKYFCVSFTILSFRLIMDTARRNGLSWDAVISCEAIGKYKVLPEAYHGCAKFLQLDPSECLMVACHNFDLDAARACGFKTAFVKRPDEWGPAGSPDPGPSEACDIVADTFPELAKAVGAL